MLLRRTECDHLAPQQSLKQIGQATNGRRHGQQLVASHVSSPSVSSERSSAAEDSLSVSSGLQDHMSSGLMCGRYPHLMPCVTSVVPRVAKLESTAHSQLRKHGKQRLSARRRRASDSFPLAAAVGSFDHIMHLASCYNLRTLNAKPAFSRRVSQVLPPSSGRCASRCFDNGTLDERGARLFMCPEEENDHEA